MRLGMRSPIKLKTRYERNRNRLSRLWRENVRGKPTPKPIIILTTSRSGSTWLTDLLTRTLSCGAIPEQFRPHHVNRNQEAQETAAIVAEVVTEIVRDLTSKRVGGTKIIWDNFPGNQLMCTPEGASNALAPLFTVDPVVIYLQRQDKIQQGISRTIAAQSGNFHHRSGKPETETGRHAGLEYDYGSIRHNIKILERADHNLQNFLRSQVSDYIPLVFETFEENPKEGLKAIVQKALPSISAADVSAKIDRGIAANTLTPSRTSVNEEWKRKYIDDSN